MHVDDRAGLGAGPEEGLPVVGVDAGEVEVGRDLAEADGPDATLGVAAGDEAGTSVSSAGDIDADGSADFLVGAPLDDPNGTDAGAGFVIYDANVVVSDVIFADGFEQ